MIYDAVDRTEPFRQGDILRDVPRADISLTNMAVLGPTGDVQIAWLDALADPSLSFRQEHEGVLERVFEVAVTVSPVTAIVISQDCDASRAKELSLCEIIRFEDVYKNFPSKPEKWVDKLTKEDSSMPKGFYLPPDARFGFAGRMAVHFQSIFRLPRTELQEAANLRVCRLNQTALEHFREKIAHFFRRFAYDPWYPLTKEEFDLYRSRQQTEAENIRPKDWQQ